MKRILGLDLGTNSIGWALVDSEEQRILGMVVGLFLWIRVCWILSVGGIR